VTVTDATPVGVIQVPYPVATLTLDQIYDGIQLDPPRPRRVHEYGAEYEDDQLQSTLEPQRARRTRRTAWVEDSIPLGSPPCPPCPPWFHHTAPGTSCSLTR